MKHLTTIVAVAAVVVFAFDLPLEAGPRGGSRSGASRGGGSVRSGGGTTRTPSASIGGGTSLPSRPSSSQFPGNGSSLNGIRNQDGNLGPSNFNLDGIKGNGSRNSDRLSGLLEDGIRQSGGGNRDGISRDQLNSFLDLPTNTTPGSVRENATGNNRPSDLRANSELANNDRNGQIYADVIEHLAGQPQPFTAQWYAQHPQAWQYTHPHADAWAAATWGAVTGWVAGVATTPTAYTYSESVVYVESTPVEEAPSATTQAIQANELAAASAPTNTNEPWLPLGVFALAEQDATSAQMLIQLSVSKSGHIGGSYYNVFSNNSQPISGAVDKETQQVAWSVVGNDAVVFHTDLASLTGDEADVLIHFAAGETQHWTLVRLPSEAE